jgi:hypothetical protein
MDERIEYFAMRHENAKFSRSTRRKDIQTLFISIISFDFFFLFFNTTQLSFNIRVNIRKIDKTNNKYGTLNAYFFPLSQMCAAFFFFCDDDNDLYLFYKRTVFVS